MHLVDGGRELFKLITIVVSGWTSTFNISLNEQC